MWVLERSASQLSPEERHVSTEETGGGGAEGEERGERIPGAWPGAKVQSSGRVGGSSCRSQPLTVC